MIVDQPCETTCFFHLQWDSICAPNGTRFHMRALEHFYMRDIRLYFSFLTPSINAITLKVGSCQSGTSMACRSKLLWTQTRGKHNEELIQTHTQDRIREPLMSMDCVSDLGREPCVQIGPKVHKVRYNTTSSFWCLKSCQNHWRLCRHVL